MHYSTVLPGGLVDVLQVYSEIETTNSVNQHMEMHDQLLVHFHFLEIQLCNNLLNCLY